MIRWTYVLPRLLLLLLAASALIFGFDPLLRWSLARAGRELVGASCDVGQVDTSFWSSRMVISQVSIANPRSPKSNLVEFETAEIDVDSIALLKKKLIIETGCLRELQIGSPRSVTGKLSPFPKESIHEKSSTTMGDFAWSPDHIRSQLNQLEEQFQSPKVAHELQQRWPQSVAEMEEQVDYLNERIAAVSLLAQQLQNDPSQTFQRLPEITGMLQQLRQDRLETEKALFRLAKQVAHDRQAVTDARRHDTQLIQNSLHWEDITASQLDDVTTALEWKQWLSEWFAWIQWTRQYLPHQMDQTEPTRGRGIQVCFPNPDALPTCMVRELHLDGKWFRASDSIPFSGTLQNATNQPKLLGTPTILTAQSRGDIPFSVNVELNHVQDPPQDSLRVHSRAFATPRLNLGKEGHLLICVEPTTAELQVVLNLTGEELDGHISLRQEKVQLVTDITGELQDSAFTKSLQSQLANIDTLATSVRLSGSVGRPRGSVESTLGRELSSALNVALRQELDSQRDHAIAKLQTQIEQSLAAAESSLRQKQDDLMSKLQLGESELQRITAILPTGSGIGDFLGSRILRKRSF